MSEYDKRRFNSICTSCQRFIKHNEVVYVKKNDPTHVHHESCLKHAFTDANRLEALAISLGYEKVNYQRINDEEV